MEWALFKSKKPKLPGNFSFSACSIPTISVVLPWEYPVSSLFSCAFPFKKWSQDDSNIPIIFEVIFYVTTRPQLILMNYSSWFQKNCEIHLLNNEPYSGKYSQMPLEKSAAAYFNCWHNINNFCALRKSRVHSSSCILYYATWMLTFKRQSSIWVKWVTTKFSDSTSFQKQS